MTFIIITGGIDLWSVRPWRLLLRTICTQPQSETVTLWRLCRLFIVVGLAAFSMAFITKSKNISLIVTLATMSAFRGLAEGISLPNTYEVPDQYYDMVKGAVHWHPFAWPDFYDAVDFHLYGLQIAGWIFVFMAVLSAVFLAKTPFGRSIYAIGHNETARPLSFLGMKVNLVSCLFMPSQG